METELIERARRVKTARLLTSHPRVFFEQHGIKSATLRSWEDPKNSKGITLKGAKKFSHALSLEGVYCSVEWLLYGTGPSARLISQKVALTQGWNEEFNILSEIELFKRSHPNAIVMLVVNDTMLPFYNPGDHVGGIFRENNFKAYDNRRCIILTETHGTLIRLLSAANENFNLSCTNPQSKESNILFNVKILKVAEIIWHRKKELT